MRTSTRRRIAKLVAGAAVLVVIMHAAPRTWALFGATTTNPAGTISAASSFYRATVIADAPSAYWRLGETSGTTAFDVMAAHNGTYGGFYTLGATGALANDTDTAFDTSGAGVLVNDAASLRYTSTFSIEAWVRPDTLTGDRFIFNKGLDYFMYFSNGVAYFGIRTPPASYPFVSSTAFTTGAWQHMVGTYSGSKLTLYRNGAQVAEVAFAGGLTTVGGNAMIGAFDTLGTSFYDGRIDEVAIYPRALTAAQVLNHYRRGALTQ